MVLHKREFKEKLKVNDKIEVKKIDSFWLGVTLGIIGGLVSDLWVAYYFRWLDHPQDTSAGFLAIISTICLVILIRFLYKKTNKTM